MGYLEMFDEEFIDSLDKWIQNNDADTSEVEPVSYTIVAKDLKDDYVDEDTQ